MCSRGEGNAPYRNKCVPPPNWNRGDSQNILIDFKQHVEDTEFQAGELVVIEIPIYPLFLKHQEINVHGYETVATNIKKKIIPQDYHRYLFALFP